MSFGAKKSKEKTSQTQTSSGTATTTPNTPDWLAQPWQQNVSGISALQNSGQPLVPGSNALLDQAYSAGSKLLPKDDGRMVNNGGGDGWSGAAKSGKPDNFGIASLLGLDAALSGPNLAGPAVMASSEGFTQAGLQERLSPYLSEVVDASLADFDYGAGQARARQVAAAAGSGGMRNSNNALRAGELDAGLQRGRATTTATLRDQGFRTASDTLSRDNDRSAATSAQNAQMANAMAMFNAGQGDNSLARQLQAAGLLSGIGTAQGADQRADISLVAGLGGQQREIDATQTEAARLAQLQALLAGVPMDAFVGRTVNQNNTGSAQGTGSSTSMGFEANLSDIATLMKLSDVRLKDDIEFVGTDGEGYRWYDYRYVWDEPGTRHRGVMAQEVQETNPQAVHVHPSGFLMVDYGALNGTV